MLKPLVSKFRSDLSVRLRDIAVKQVPAKLKPIVVLCVLFSASSNVVSIGVLKRNDSSSFKIDGYIEAEKCVS